MYKMLQLAHFLFRLTEWLQSNEKDSKQNFREEILVVLLYVKMLRFVFTLINKFFLWHNFHLTFSGMFDVI